MKIKVGNSNIRINGGNRTANGMGRIFGLARKATVSDVTKFGVIMVLFGLIFAGAGVFMIISIEDSVRFLGAVFAIPGLLFAFFGFKQIKRYAIDKEPVNKYVIKSGSRTSLVDGPRCGYPLRHADLTKEQEAELERNRLLIQSNGILGFIIPFVIAVAGGYFLRDTFISMLTGDTTAVVDGPVLIFGWVVGSLVIFIPTYIVTKIILKAVRFAKHSK